MSESSLRAYGHACLVAWAHQRPVVNEGLGATGISITEKMRLAAQGGGASTAPARLTPTERQADRGAWTLRVEQAVRSLQDAQRRAVFDRYVRGEAVAARARRLGIEDRDARNCLAEGVETVARDLKFGAQSRQKQRLVRRRKSAKDRI